MQLMIYYDYLCEDSYQVFRWVERLNQDRPDLRITWATFSLRELNRRPEEPSFLSGGAPHDPTVLALALAHAARQTDFALYHQTVFNAVHAQGQQITEPALMAWARQAGIDWDAFKAQESRWIQELAHDHEYGRKRWGVRSTPTLVFNSKAAVTLKLSAPPPSEPQALELLDRLGTLALDLPEVQLLRRIEP